jgi:hypothetical protein
VSEMRSTDQAADDVDRRPKMTVPKRYDHIACRVAVRPHDRLTLHRDDPPTVLILMRDARSGCRVREV